jgi:hypothetical protein
MNPKKLLISTALVETAAGLVLLVSPRLCTAFLLDAPAALVVDRRRFLRRRQLLCTRRWPSGASRVCGADRVPERDGPSSSICRNQPINGF